MGLFDFLKKDKDIILGVEFPKFKGKLCWGYNGITTHSSKYKRKDYYYIQNPEEVNNYIALINSYGFFKTSEIKYTKSNSYIIIENLSNKLHIAFHVNK